MISQVMNYCKNHFWRSRERQLYTFVSDGIVGDFNETYLVGQYIHVVGSMLNDGVYKITAVSDAKLTLDATLTAESTTDVYTTIYGCAVPSAFLSVVDDIETWVTANAGKEGLASETIDSYSYSFASDAKGVHNNWQTAFASRLTPFKKIYEEWRFYGYR